MKMTKRIFIALLVIAVMVSSLALTAFAAEYTLEDYSNVLEYFDEPTLFCYDFAGEDGLPSSNLLLKNPDQTVAQINTDQCQHVAGILTTEPDKETGTCHTACKADGCD